jgi:chromosome segregation ATPase
MAGHNAIPPIASGNLESFTQFLNFLDDTEKFQERLDEMEKIRAEVNERIVLYGTTEEIDQLHSAAIRDAEQASKTVDKAVANRDKILEDLEIAEATAKNTIAARQSLFDANTNKREADLRDGLNEISRREGVLESAYIEFEGTKKRARQAIIDGADAKNKYEAGLESLNGVLAVLKESVNAAVEAI